MTPRTLLTIAMVFFALAALVVVFWISTARAGTIDINPPTEFQGNATVTVRFVTAERLQEICTALLGDPNGRWAGCVDNFGAIIIENPCALEYWRSPYRQAICHELGHINGWPADHRSGQ